MTYAATAAWLRPRLWIAAVVGAVPWVVWVASLAVGGWYKDAEGTLVGADHLAFFTAAHLVRDGQQGRMYDYLDLGNGYQRALIGWDWSGFEAYRNPPFYVLIYLPTAGVSYYASFLIWTAIGFALLALSIRLLNPQWPALAFFWALGFYPVFATISFGQNTFISLAVFAGVYRLLRADRRFAAGLLAGLLWFKPQLLLGLFIWWAIFPGRFFRCWIGVAATGLALAALSWLALPDASESFIRTLETNLGFTGENEWNKHSPRAFWGMLLPKSVAGLATRPAVLILGSACSLAGLAVAWRVARRTGAPVAVMFPVAVFLSLWASPHALIYEWSLLVAAAVVLWEEFPASRDVWLCLFTLVWLVLTVSTTLALVQIRHLHLPVAVQVSIPILGATGWLAARELIAARSLGAPE